MEVSYNIFNRLLLIIGNIVSYLVLVIVFIIYNSGGIRYHPSYISDLHLTKITPADWTYSIWILGLILSGIFVVYQALPTKRESHLIFVGIGPFYILKNFFVLIWFFCFSYNVIWAAFIFLLAALVTLVVIYVRLGINYYTEIRNRTDVQGNPMTQADFWILQLPFSLGLGWLTFSIFVNLGAALSGKDLGWNAQGWSVIVQIIWIIISFVVLRIRHDPFFTAPIAWGLFGIADRWRHDDVVVTSALVAAVVIGIATLVTFVHVLFFHLYRTERYASIHN